LQKKVKFGHGIIFQKACHREGLGGYLWYKKLHLGAKE
jgi:hypothetical protein